MHKMKPAVTDELGFQYWMSRIGDGIRQSTIEVPDEFDISSRVNNNMFNYTILQRQGKTTRDDKWASEEMWDLEYVKMIHVFETEYEFKSCCGFVGDYTQAFQIKRAVDISKDVHQSYGPLESSLKDASKQPTTHKHIETTLDTSTESFLKLYN